MKKINSISSQILLIIIVAVLSSCNGHAADQDDESSYYASLAKALLDLDREQDITKKKHAAFKSLDLVS